MSGGWVKAGPSHTGTRQWRKVRAQVLERDRGICHVCGEPGSDQVDHLVPWHLTHDDSPDNLAPIHSEPCHRVKTQQEAAAARRALGTQARPPEGHPGLRTT